MMTSSHRMDLMTSSVQKSFPILFRHLTETLFFLLLAPYLEPEFDYSNPIEDAAVQRILAVRDRTQATMAPPTAPPPVDMVSKRGRRREKREAEENSLFFSYFLMTSPSFLSAMTSCFIIVSDADDVILTLSQPTLSYSCHC